MSVDLDNLILGKTSYLMIAHVLNSDRLILLSKHYILQLRFRASSIGFFTELKHLYKPRTRVNGNYSLAEQFQSILISLKARLKRVGLSETNQSICSLLRTAKFEIKTFSFNEKRPLAFLL